MTHTTTVGDTDTTPTRPDETGSGEAEPLERVIEILDDGAIVVLAALGHETGLLDMLATLPPSTSIQIADAAGLDERYVREWLAGMVTGRLVDYEPGPRRYSLRTEVIPFLTGSGADNLARQMAMLVLLSQAAPGIGECFRAGGGLGYEDYPGFHRAMAQESAAVNDAALLDVIVPLTGCTDTLIEGIDVADVGCGQGHAVNLMAKAFPHSRFTGYDFSTEALDAARAEADAWGLDNARFTWADIATLDVRGEYDLVTAFDTIHDQAHPATVLSVIHESLRPGGAFLMVDIKASSHLEQNIDLPWASLLYTLSTMHCMSVSVGQGGDGLGTAWGVELAEQMIREAGFGTVDLVDVEADPFNCYVLART